MEQNEFIELSKKEVKELNAGYGEVDQHSESWRGGYVYAMKEISNIVNDSNLHLDDFMVKLEDFVNQNVDEFDADDV